MTILDLFIALVLNPGQPLVIVPLLALDRSSRLHHHWISEVPKMSLFLNHLSLSIFVI